MNLYSEKPKAAAHLKTIVLMEDPFTISTGDRIHSGPSDEEHDVNLYSEDTVKLLTSQLDSYCTAFPWHSPPGKISNRFLILTEEECETAKELRIVINKMEDILGLASDVMTLSSNGRSHHHQHLYKQVRDITTMAQSYWQQDIGTGKTLAEQLETAKGTLAICENSYRNGMVDVLLAPARYEDHVKRNYNMVRLNASYMLAYRATVTKILDYNCAASVRNLVLPELLKMLTDAMADCWVDDNRDVEERIRHLRGMTDKALHHYHGNALDVKIKGYDDSFVVRPQPPEEEKEPKKENLIYKYFNSFIKGFKR